MNFDKRIEKIDIDNDRLHVFYAGGKKSDILYNELKDIYITVNKISPLYELLIIVSCAIITLFAYFQLQSNFILIISFLLIVAIILKMNNHKRYGMKINLKNGISFKKDVPLKSKNKTVDFVNDVRRKIYDYKIETSNILP